MTRKKKKIILILLLGGILFFEGRRVTFLFECLSATTELEKNYEVNKAMFSNLTRFVNGSSPIQFDLYSNDSLYMTFQDSSIYYIDLFVDSNYTIKPETTSEFKINNKGCLEVIKTDTIEVCNNNWQVQFFGHYKDQRINYLLKYYGWKRKDFEQLVEKVQRLNCYGFALDNNKYVLSYKTVSYYNDGQLHCFGHSDGYFDYLYTTHPDSFYWQNSITNLEGNYYGIKHWNF